MPARLLLVLLILAGCRNKVPSPQLRDSGRYQKPPLLPEFPVNSIIITHLGDSEDVLDMYVIRQHDNRTDIMIKHPDGGRTRETILDAKSFQELIRFTRLNGLKDLHQSILPGEGIYPPFGTFKFQFNGPDESHDIILNPRHSLTYLEKLSIFIGMHDYIPEIMRNLDYYILLMK